MKFKQEPNNNNYPVPNRYNTVIKANTLIQRSRFSLSAQQQKIVLFIISQIEPYDEEFKLYEFKITEFCKVCGIEPKGDIYSLLKNQIKAISDKSLWIELENGEETLVRWIEKPYIDKKSGTIKIKIDEDMKPYLLQLKERFTEYDLIYTLNFKSKYSIRLYEYLKSIHYKKLQPYTQTISIDKFQKMLDSTYEDFKDFHTRVLKPAQKEINTYSDILFNYELIKEGRKVVAIVIDIETKETVERMRITGENERLLEERYGKSE
ncbi:MAG: replication initiation protein [Clostridia bacterium]|jgi:plasmid replication initiation protein|nr:replication initiation protein [Clostridia bacterium]